MGDANSMTQILWSTDPSTQRAIWMVLGLALVTVVAVFAPLIVRLIRIFLLERKLRALIEEDLGPDGRANHADVLELMLDSPLRVAFEEFERRWKTARLIEGIDRAPIRLIDVLEDKPLLAFGPRRSLLPVLPGLFLGVGVFAALFGLIPSLAEMTSSDVTEGARSGWMAAQLGLALRATAWGFLGALGASVLSRLIEGGFDARSHRLDELVESAFGSVSPGELAEITRQTQQKSLDTLGRELTHFAGELNERLDRGLQRIEQSTARSANLVSQEQRGALHTVVQELSLSVRQGVEHHLSELRSALQRAVDHQTSVTGGLAETFERMVENSQTQDRVARTLSESAVSVEEAARAMHSSTVEMHPVLENLGITSRALADTAERIGDTQAVVARTAEGVRSSLEHAASGVDDQRKFMELSLTEIRRTLVGLGDGLGDSLQRSLREVDGVLAGTVGQLRDTLAESNETIERLAGPIRAAEGTTRETHLALDRMRSEVEALGAWLNMAIKPLRSGLIDVDGRAEEIARAITEFTNHTRQIDKTMESLREEIHEESRRLQGTGSELGRRLKLASDVSGLLDGAPDANRRGRAEGLTSTRDRSWSPAPGRVDLPLEASPSDSADPLATTTPDVIPNYKSRYASETPDRSEREDIETEGAGATSEGDSAKSGSNGRVEGVAEELDRTSRDLTLSGYRVGAPRAHGPDPYARFEETEETPSNVRHFPTRDRELGENLKLSGLLGPRGPEPIGIGDDEITLETDPEEDETPDRARTSDDAE